MPGATTQGGDALNYVLQELALNYDLEPAMRQGTLNLNSGSGVGTIGVGSGPYLLPSDYLRMWRDDITYSVFGVPYKMVSVDLDSFFNLVQQPGISNFPEQFATDISNDAVAKYGAKVLYVWPPSGMSLTPRFSYWSLPSDISNPATSSVVPWFPNANYLITRVAGEIMKLTDDSRAAAFLGEGPDGAQGILNRYLKSQSDDEGRAQTVMLDRQRFGKSFQNVPQTKLLGW